MMKERKLPKISIITPSLNQGHYLQQCLDSIIMQNYRNLEMIIIDGGSSDDTISIIKAYEDKISYWISEPDKGQSEAINKGVQKASGELVAWLNADDYYLPSALDHVVDAYRANRSAPFYFGNGLRVDEKGETISKFFPTETLTFNREALILGLNYILQPSTFINRHALDRIGHLDVSLHYGMDSDLWIRLSAVGKPCIINDVLAASREYTETKTASGSFARTEELRQIAERHSGLPITPGGICYYLDTLYRCVRHHGDIFPGHYLTDVTHFWKQTAKLLSQFNSKPNGFPRESKKGNRQDK